MIELFFVACLDEQIRHCEEHSLLFAETTVMTCMIQAQPQLSMWREANRGWSIHQWSCRPHNSTAVEA